MHFDASRDDKDNGKGDDSCSREVDTVDKRNDSNSQPWIQ